MCLATPCIDSNVQIIAMVKLLSLYGSLRSHQTAWNKCTYEKSLCVYQGTRNVCWCKITCLLTMITSFRNILPQDSIWLLHSTRKKMQYCHLRGQDEIRMLTTGVCWRWWWNWEPQAALASTARHEADQRFGPWWTSLSRCPSPQNPIHEAWETDPGSEWLMHWWSSK